MHNRKIKHSFMRFMLTTSLGLHASCGVNANNSSTQEIEQLSIGKVIPLPDALKNHPSGYEITHQMLLAAVAVTQPCANPEKIKFLIERVNSGVLRLGSSQSGIDIATLPTLPRIVNSNADNTLSTLSLNWTPPQNITGDLSIMTVRVFNGKSVSPTTADIRINVQKPNNKPTINSELIIGGVGTETTGTFQNVKLDISHELLLKLTQAADEDATPLSFTVSRLENGTLKHGEITYTQTGPLAQGPTIGPGQSISWTPPLNTYGRDTDNPPQPVHAFRIKAFDGTDVSTTESIVKINVTPVNQPPALAEAATLQGCRNVTKEISVHELADALRVTDFEDTPDPNIASAIRYSSMKFRVEILGGAQLKVGTTLADSVVVDPSQNVFLPSQKLYWFPPMNATGVFTAVSFTAIDSSNVSSIGAATVDVQIIGGGCY